MQAWRWRCTESRAVGQRHGRKGICRGAGRAWRLPMPHCRDHCSPLWTFPVCPGVICTGMTTRKPFIDPPSYAVNKESEAQQMNRLPNFIQPRVEVEPNQDPPRETSHGLGLLVLIYSSLIVTEFIVNQCFSEVRVSPSLIPGESASESPRARWYADSQALHRGCHLLGSGAGEMHVFNRHLRRFLWDIVSF